MKTLYYLSRFIFLLKIVIIRNCTKLRTMSMINLFEVALARESRGDFFFVFFKYLSPNIIFKNKTI